MHPLRTVNRRYRESIRAQGRQYKEEMSVLEGAKVAVVVPCHNESHQIKRVLDTMPDCVDRVYIIDDCSDDDTAKVVAEYVAQAQRQLILIEHETNQGVGGAIASGYKAALADQMDVTVVMAGDAQMDPCEFEKIAGPVARGECDYTKGNRLTSGDAWEMIPRVRYIGNSILSLLTKIASGYWHTADSQSGYAAIGLNALKTINWDKMYKRYGQPNDLLVRLNIYNFRVRDVSIQPVYGVGEKSGLRPIRMIPSLSWLIIKLFFYRMKEKYIIRDFHPLLFFYTFGLFLAPTGALFGLYLFVYRLCCGSVAATSALFSAFLIIMGMQFILFAMWMDMEYNKDLR